MISVLAGLGLKTEEFSKAFQRLKFNLFIQVFNLGAVSSIVFGVSRGLASVNAISHGLADGMVVCASLPLTINMVLVLTKSSGGDEAAAIFNAAFGNMLGVFLSPVLILGYLGVTGDIELLQVFYKLCARVVLPVTVGQLLQKFSKPVTDFVKKYKPRFKTAQQYALIFIIYTVFCRTFSKEDNDSNIQDIFVMIIVQFILLCSLMVLAWISLKFLFPDEPKLRVMGLFGCTHKTVSVCEIELEHHGRIRGHVHILTLLLMSLLSSNVPSISSLARSPWAYLLSMLFMKTTLSLDCIHCHY